MKSVAFSCFILFTPVLIMGQCPDIEPPDIGNYPPIQISAECDDIPEYDLQASDNSGGFVITYDEELFFSNCIGTLIRSWTVADSCGNETHATQIVSLEDNSPPVLINTPQDTTIFCDDALPEIPNLIAYDNCDSDPQISFYENIIMANPFPLILRSWVVQDDCFNETSWHQNIFVVDVEAPELMFLSDTSVILPFGQDLWEVPNLSSWGTISDNCDENPSYSQSVSEGTLLPIGSHEITIVSSDASGNEGSTSIQIFIDQSVGIGELNSFPITGFPNPAVEQITFDIDAHVDLPEMLLIRDISGRMVSEQVITQHALIFSLNGILPGIYTAEFFRNQQFLGNFQFVKLSH